MTTKSLFATSLFQPGLAISLCLCLIACSPQPNTPPLAQGSQSGIQANSTLGNTPVVPATMPDIQKATPVELLKNLQNFDTLLSQSAQTPPDLDPAEQALYELGPQVDPALRQQILAALDKQVKELEAKGTRSLSGIIQPATKQTDFKGWSVVAYAPSGRELSRVTPDNQGNFTLQGIPSGVRIQVVAAEALQNLVLRSFYDVDESNSLQLNEATTAVADILRHAKQKGDSGVEKLSIQELTTLTQTNLKEVVDQQVAVQKAKQEELKALLPNPEEAKLINDPSMAELFAVGDFKIQQENEEITKLKETLKLTEEEKKGLEESLNKLRPLLDQATRDADFIYAQIYDKMRRYDDYKEALERAKEELETVKKETQDALEGLTSNTTRKEDVINLKKKQLNELLPRYKQLDDEIFTLRDTGADNSIRHLPRAEQRRLIRVRDKRTAFFEDPNYEYRVRRFPEYDKLANTIGTLLAQIHNETYETRNTYNTQLQYLTSEPVQKSQNNLNSWTERTQKAEKDYLTLLDEYHKKEDYRVTLFKKYEAMALRFHALKKLQVEQAASLEQTIKKVALDSLINYPDNPLLAKEVENAGLITQTIKGAFLQTELQTRFLWRARNKFPNYSGLELYIIPLKAGLPGRLISINANALSKTVESVETLSLKQGNLSLRLLGHQGIDLSLDDLDPFTPYQVIVRDVFSERFNQTLNSGVASSEFTGTPPQNARLVLTAPPQLIGGSETRGFRPPSHLGIFPGLEDITLALPASDADLEAWLKGQVAQTALTVQSTKIQLQNLTRQWNVNDIGGYRIYRNGQLEATIPRNQFSQYVNSNSPNVLNYVFKNIGDKPIDIKYELFYRNTDRTLTFPQTIHGVGLETPIITASEPLEVKAYPNPEPDQGYSQIVLEFKALPNVKNYRIFKDRMFWKFAQGNPGETVKVIIDGLTPATGYNFEVVTDEPSQPSTGTEIQARTLSSSAGKTIDFVPAPVAPVAPAAPGATPTPPPPPPVLTGKNISYGLVGATITLTGTNFGATPGANTVKFGSTIANVISASPTSLTAEIPVISSGSTSITVTVAGNTSGSLNFLVVDPQGQYQVNTYTTGEQDESSVAMDSQGNYVVVWVSDGSSGTDNFSSSIQGQRYNSAGVAQGSEFQVNSFTQAGEIIPNVSMNSNGDFVVVWQASGSIPEDSDGWAVRGRRFNSSGVAQGSEFQVNTYTTSSQQNAKVAMDNTGNFVVTWYSDTGNGTDTTTSSIQARRFNSAGVGQGSQFQVNTYTTSSQQNPSVAMDSDGDFVIAWYSTGSSDTDTDSLSIQAQRYNSSGITQGSQFQVNTYTTSHQFNPNVAMDSAGNFVVAWQSTGSSGTDTSSSSIQGQRYNSSGVAQGSQFQANTYTTSSQEEAKIAMDSDGDFVIAWRNNSAISSIGTQCFNSAGIPQGSEYNANEATTPSPFQISLAMDAEGNHVVSWMHNTPTATDTSARSILARRFNRAGQHQ